MLLDINQIVDIMILQIESVDGDILDNLGLSFGTTLDPFYSTPNRVRALVGSYLTEVPDQIILYLINSYSIEANNLAICNIGKWPKWEYYASLWVANRVALNAIINSKTYLDEAGQKVYKKLGDFSISKDGTGDTSPLKIIVDKLECDILKLAVAVKFCKEPLIDCVKGVASNDLRNSSAMQLVKKGELTPNILVGRTFRQAGYTPMLTKYIKEYDRLIATNFMPVISPYREDYQQDSYVLSNSKS
jgi:hypothetical protein